MIPDSSFLGRRRVLKIGLAFAGTLAAAGGLSGWLDMPPTGPFRLKQSGQRVFKAIAGAVLEGTLHPDPTLRETQLDAHLLRLERLLVGLPTSTQREVSMLLALLANAITRYGLTTLRPPWPDASLGERLQALDDMRHSGSSLRQQTYHALRDLTNAAFYADPEAWPLMGYPGPTPL